MCPDGAFSDSPLIPVERRVPDERELVALAGKNQAAQERGQPSILLRYTVDPIREFRHCFLES